MAKAIDPSYDHSTETTALFLPFYHIYGYTLLMASIVYGSQAIVFSHFDPLLFLKVVQTYKVSDPSFPFKVKIRSVPMVPPILVFLAKHPAVDKFDLSSLEFITSGAAPAGKDLIEEVKKRFPNVKVLRQGLLSSFTNTSQDME